MTPDLQRLAVRYIAHSSPVNREAVVRAAIPLVRSLVSRLSVPDHILASRDDLENVGMVGLLQALDAFDPERGTPFISYAYGRVRGALIDYLRSIDILPRERRRRLAEAQQALESLRQTLGREPKDHEVAHHLNISLVKYHGIMMDGQRRYALSLHDPVSDDGQSQMLETLPNDEAQAAFDQIEQDSLNAHVAALIRQLPQRQQTILALYYYENLTLTEIAQVLGLTGARISQILSKIHRTLRERLAEPTSMAA